MKKLLILVAVATVMAGCSSTDPYTKRADAERERQEKYADRALSKAPKWMTEVPKSTSAVYANGTAVSGDFAFADEKAKSIAFGTICMAAAGTVDKSSRVFRTDVGTTSTESSEMAIRSMCRGVDVTGAEVVEIARVTEGSRFRSYVLVALPMGEANLLKKAKLEEAIQRATATRATQAFQEMDLRN